MEDHQKKMLEDVCEKKNLALYEYCQRAIVNALNNEVKV